MKEIELKKSNNGLAVLTAVCVLYLCALVAVIISENVVLDILACVWMALGWILLAEAIFAGLYYAVTTLCLRYRLDLE